MKIPCSNCDQRLEIPEELAGQTIECPSCKASLNVPSLDIATVTEPIGTQSKLTPQIVLRSFLLFNLLIIIAMFCFISGEALSNMVLVSQTIAGLVAILLICLPISIGQRANLFWKGLAALGGPLCLLFIGAFIAEIILGIRVGTDWAITAFYLGVIPFNLFAFYQLR